MLWLRETPTSSPAVFDTLQKLPTHTVILHPTTSGQVLLCFDKTVLYRTGLFKVFCCRCCYFNNLSTFSWNTEIVLSVYVCGKPVYVCGKPVYVCGKLLITMVLSSLDVCFSLV